jgi:hypothetical protein
MEFANVLVNAKTLRTRATLLYLFGGKPCLRIGNLGAIVFALRYR